MRPADNALPYHARGTDPKLAMRDLPGLMPEREDTRIGRGSDHASLGVCIWGFVCVAGFLGVVVEPPKTEGIGGELVAHR